MTANPSELPNLLKGMTDKVPPKKAFIIGKENLSYGDFQEKVAQTRGLFIRLNIKKNDRILLASQSDEAVSIIFTAALLSGITTAIIDPLCSASEANILATEAMPSCAFLDKEFVDRVEAISRTEGPRIISITNNLEKKTSFGLIIRRKSNVENNNHFPAMLKNETCINSCECIPSDNIALILFTSGTTSKPKGVMLTHKNLAAQLKTFQNHYGYNQESRISNHLRLHHTDGINHGMLLTMSLGATWIRPTNINMQNLAEIIDWSYSKKITHFITVPTVLAMMLRLPEMYNDSFQNPYFKYISSSAAYLDENLWQEIESRFGVMVVNSYGLTETVVEAIYCGPDAQTRKIGTIGKPVDCDAKIIDEEGNEVAVNETGMLLLKGDNVMPGYFNNPTATEEIFDDGWLITGDLATQDNEGFYYIVGRAKSVIIRGGTNIYPEDINTNLLMMDEIAEAATIGIEDPIVGEKVVSAIVLNDQKQSLDINAVFDHCRNNMAPEKIPSSIIIIDELTKGPAGKVELNKLKHFINNQNNINNSMNDAAVDKQVILVAATTFRQPENLISINSSPDNTVGWDSLAFLEFIVALENHFNIEFSPRNVMSIRTINDVIEIIIKGKE